VGYRKSGTKEYIQFNKPMKQFSKSRRKFIELKPVEKYITDYRSAGEMARAA
jgi:hypothetical protein